jgi:5-methylcytosine-specific restriction endonuclease McrA
MATEEEQREYQRLWILERRQDWIAANGPCNECGSWDELEVDHVDAATKSMYVSVVWSMALDNPKRVAELAKCQVLCHPCHIEKSRVAGDFKRGKLHGEQMWNTHLSDSDVEDIVRLLATGTMTHRVVGEKFGVARNVITDINRGATWKHIPR